MKCPCAVPKLALAFLCACSSRTSHTKTVDTPAAGPKASERNAAAEEAQSARDIAKDEPDSIAACRSENIALPPEFAPSLPKGQETLWFAPGMFDADAPGYYRYAFELHFSDPQPVGVGALEKLLTSYYQGLMSAVAEGKGHTHAPLATRVVVKASPGGDASETCEGASCVDANRFFEARINTLDEFNTGKPIKLRVLLDATATEISALVTLESTRMEHSLVVAHGQPRQRDHARILGCSMTP